MNLKMKQFEDALIQLIDASELPVEAVRLILANTLMKVEQVSIQAIEKELEEISKKEDKNHAEST